MSDLNEQALDDDQRKACDTMLCETVARHSLEGEPATSDVHGPHRSGWFARLRGRPRGG